MKNSQSVHSFFSSFSSYFSSNIRPSLVKVLPHVLLVLFMLGVLLVCSITSSGKIAEKFTGMENINNPTMYTEKEQFIIDQFDIRQVGNARLLAQLQMAGDQVKKYYSMMKFFYIQYYMSLFTVLLFTLVSAIALLFISKKGWDQVNRYVITIFFTAVAITVFFGAFPQVFQHTKNISDNKTLFLENEAIKNEIISYMATGEGIDGKRTELRTYVHYIDRKLSESNNIPLGFDESKMPDFKEVFPE